MPDVILIVDDDPRLARGLLTRLRAAGYEAAHAEHGAGALDALKTLRPSAIILDIRLPDMDGFRVCELIRADPANGRMPILFLSANASGEDRRRALAVGGTVFLAKPCDSATLLAALRSACGERPPAPSTTSPPATHRPLASEVDRAA